MPRVIAALEVAIATDNELAEQRAIVCWVENMFRTEAKLFLTRLMVPPLNQLGRANEQELEEEPGRAGRDPQTVEGV